MKSLYLFINFLGFCATGAYSQIDTLLCKKYIFPLDSFFTVYSFPNNCCCKRLIKEPGILSNHRFNSKTESAVNFTLVSPKLDTIYIYSFDSSGNFLFCYIYYHSFKLGCFRGWDESERLDAVKVYYIDDRSIKMKTLINISRKKYIKQKAKRNSLKIIFHNKNDF